VGFQVHLSLSWGVQLLVQGDLNHFSNLTISHVNQAIVALQQVVLLAPVPQQQLVVLQQVVLLAPVPQQQQVVLLVRVPQQQLVVLQQVVLLEEVVVVVVFDWGFELILLCVLS